MSIETNSNEKIVTIRAKAFSGSKMESVRVMVPESGQVRVWDSVAGHYTTCHSLSPSAVRRARVAAAAE